jgi:urease accessory protein UreH
MPCNAAPSSNAGSETQSIEKVYSADAAGFEDASAVGPEVGARLEWIAGECITWLVGFCSASCRSVTSQHAIEGGDV